MTKRPISLPSFNAVAAGQTATIDLPADGTYHALMITYTTDTAGGSTQANMETELTEFRIKVNGKVQRRFSAEELFDLNAYHGEAFTTGKAPIFFAEQWRRTMQGEDVLAWGMADVDTFQIEIDIANNSSQVCTLSAKRLWTPDNRPMGQIVKWRKQTVPVTATGIVNVTTLNKNDAYYALHAHSAVCDDVEVKVDLEERWKLDLADSKLIDGFYGRAPVTGWFHVPFEFTNRASDALIMRRPDGSAVKDFQVDFNMNTATTFTLISETLGLRD